MAEAQGNPYGQLIARAWSDEGFKARLLADPKAAMTEVGMDVPAWTCRKGWRSRR